MPTVNRRSFLFVGLGAVPLLLRFPSVGVAAPVSPLVQVPRGFHTRCSFCNRSTTETLFMMAAPGVQICNECIALCAELIREEALPERSRQKPPEETPAPDWLTQNRAPTREEVITLMRGRSTVSIEEGPEFEERVVELMRLLDPVERAKRLAQATSNIAKTSVSYLPAPTRKLASAKLACSFCERPQSAVEKLIAGPTVYVCNDCIGDAQTLIGHGVLK